MNQIKLALVDDDNLITSLLKDYFKKDKHIAVQLTCGSGEAFLTTLEEEKLSLDVVVLDLQMKATNGVEVAKKVKADYPNIQIIVLSSHYQLSFMGFMMKLGVSAFLPKGISPSELTKVILEVSANGYYFLPDQLTMLSKQILSSVPQPVLEETNQLTEREIEVIRLICHQKTAKEIAKELFLSQRTVESHRNSLLQKTGAKNAAGLVVYAIQNQLINPNDILIL